MNDIQLSLNLLEGYTKAVFPSVTTALGINEITQQILFDAGSFNTTIQFDVDLEPSETITKKEYLVEQAFEQHCRHCKFYSRLDSEYELDKQALSNLIDDLRDLKDLSNNLMIILNMSDIQRNYELGSLYELLSGLQNCIEHTFPTNLITDYRLNATNYYLIDVILDNSHVELTKFTKESVSSIGITSHNIRKACGSVLQVKHSKKKILINSESSLTFNLLNSILKLKFDKKLKQSTRFSYTMPQIVEYIVTKSLELIERLEANHKLVINSINVIKRCPGIRGLFYLDDCFEYPTLMPTILINVFEADEDDEYNGEDREDDDFEDKINLRINPHYYLLQYPRAKMYIYKKVEITPDKQRLKLHPFNFPNINSQGLVCLDDNSEDVLQSFTVGKFSNILEIFWNSNFNHDLALNNGFNSKYDTYTFEYHDFLVVLH
jgi:hypothetical protein